MNLLAMVGDFLRHASRWLVCRYYADIEITGREHIPVTGPALFVANHPNSMLDPAVVGLIAGRAVHFFAKAPLFNVPVLGVLMRALGMIPAFRGRDDPRQTHRNFESLADATEWLARGEAVGIFPEGLSHDWLRVEMVRGGAARVAIQAARRDIRVVVVPVGLNYECKEQFRSAVWVRVGEPLDVFSALSDSTEDDRKSTRVLTNEIGRRLKLVALHLNEDAWGHLLPGLEVMLPPPPEFAHVPAAPLRQRKRIADAMNYFLATDRPRAEAMAAVIEQHRDALATEKMSARSDVMQFHGKRLFIRMMRQSLWLLGSFPAAMAGIVHHFVPFWATHILANLVKMEDRTTLALNRMLMGVLVYPLWYALVWTWISGWTRPWIATLWTVLMPLAGLRALHFIRTARSTASVPWYELRLLLRPRRLYELRRQRLEVRHQLRQFAADYATVRARNESFE